jgi:hypothetical protein
MKRTSLARKTPLKASKGFSKAKSSLSRKKPAKRKNSPSKTKPIDRTPIPKWFQSIKPGAHGNTPTQKRYWKLISDFVRQRDFNKYNGKCVSCKIHLQHWKDGDAAHFKRYSVCNSYFKFNPANIALSCKGCNRNDDGVVGHHFGKSLEKRYGKDHIDWIEKENKKYQGMKIENAELIRLAEKLVEDNPWFIVP